MQTLHLFHRGTRGNPPSKSAIQTEPQPYTLAYHSSDTFIQNNTIQDSIRVLHFFVLVCILMNFKGQKKLIS